MAALGWLINLHFAGGGGAVPVVPGGETLEETGLRRPPIAYQYGYHYIKKVPQWKTSSSEA